MTANHAACRLLPDRSAALADRAARIVQEADTPFEAARRLVPLLGAHYADGETEIGFWAPELEEQASGERQVFLEVCTPLDALDLRAREQRAAFRRDRLALLRQGAYVWGVVAGMRPGSRDQVGSFYRLAYQDAEGSWRHIQDVLAYSVPFGAFAPAELYDVSRMQRERADAAYFATLEGITQKNGRPQLGPPLHLLQLHPGTSSGEGTLAGLTRIYRRIAQKIEEETPLTPAEQNYAAYDAVQLMPIEPTVAYEAGPGCWAVEETEGAETESETEVVTVRLGAPDMTNWGYDIVIAASSAVNPVVLETKRPDELVDFIATLHTFPGKPIRVLFDVVFGHADNQAKQVLNRHFFGEAGMYGMELDHQHPVVRAILLEMQRRKTNFGADGLRVDGAQDFTYRDPETGQHVHDDAYLQAMSDVVQEVAGTPYYPWMIFEDGRPWPHGDWELSSTYRAVIEQQPGVFQWGPLTFAHNTPFLFTFWVRKWWRIEEMLAFGSQWISGCANHDTLRRGSQVDPEARINRNLGDTLPEILRNAYDNPATNLLMHGFMPGVPMDFINALMRAPWSFIRNTDDQYLVKIVSEEARFLWWCVDEERYARDEHFTRLKALGFTGFAPLRRFLHVLEKIVEATDYDLEAIVQMFRAARSALMPGEVSEAALKRIGRAWMDDLHDYCNVTHYAGDLDPARTAFNAAVRRFRMERPWLMDDLGPEDFFTYRKPCNGTVLFYGLRRAPDQGEQLLFAANMEGQPTTILPVELMIPDLPVEGWQVALTTPGMDVEAPDAPVLLQNSEGVLLVR